MPIDLTARAYWRMDARAKAKQWNRMPWCTMALMTPGIIPGACASRTCFGAQVPRQGGAALGDSGRRAGSPFGRPKPNLGTDLHRFTRALEPSETPCHVPALAPVAQRTEQRFPKPKATSSTLVGGAEQRREMRAYLPRPGIRLTGPRLASPLPRRAIWGRATTRCPGWCRVARGTPDATRGDAL